MCVMRRFGHAVDDLNVPTRTGLGYQSPWPILIVKLNWTDYRSGDLRKRSSCIFWLRARDEEDGATLSPKSHNLILSYLGDLKKKNTEQRRENNAERGLTLSLRIQFLNREN
jgi:hypothetical protein